MNGTLFRSTLMGKQPLLVARMAQSQCYNPVMMWEKGLNRCEKMMTHLTIADIYVYIYIYQGWWGICSVPAQGSVGHPYVHPI